VTAFPVLTDGVIELRVLEASDAECLIAGQDDDVIRLLTGTRFSLAEAVEWIESVRECWTEGRHRRNFGIWASDKLIGGIDAHTGWTMVQGIEQGDANIAFWLAPRGRGFGYAPRAVRLVCQYLGGLEVARAIIRTRCGNDAANRVAERAGCTRLDAAGDELQRWSFLLAQPSRGAPEA